MNKIIALLLSLIVFTPWLANADVAVPALTGHVIDQTGTLNTEQISDLEQKLTAIEIKKGSQVVVLLIPSTSPETIEQFALRAAEQWKIGRKKIDDGVILLIAKNDRSLRIEVGYGLEGALTDATSKRIIAEIITPYFKQGDFAGGINAGVDQIIKVIDGEPLPEPTAYSSSNSGHKVGSYLPVMIIVGLVLGSILCKLLGKLFGSLTTGGIIALIAWIFIGTLSITFIAGVIAFLFTLINSSSSGRGGSGGFGGGGFGGGSGGFGGGGFSGGGGSFGGGGASGRW